MTHEFVGHLTTYDKKGEGNEIVDENVLLEVVEAKSDGQVELAFTDRNERCYLTFNLPELLKHSLRQGMPEDK